ncbi:MAG: DUF3887 domain-containing protein [Erythrobacter sp.]
MPIKIIAAACFALLLSACNPMAQLESSKEQVTQFHAVYNDGDARTLYGMTAPEFRDVTSIEQMNELVAYVTEKMGKVESAERAGFNIDSQNGETQTIVTMTTQFEKGEATETFTFKGTGDDLGLTGWNVDSPNFQDDAEPESVQEDGAPTE